MMKSGIFDKLAQQLNSVYALISSQNIGTRIGQKAEGNFHKASWISISRPPCKSASRLEQNSVSQGTGASEMKLLERQPRLRSLGH